MMVLDLFSGIGGFSLAAHWAGHETAAFCEVDPFCQKVLAKNFPDIPIYDDVRTLTRERMEADGIAAIDVICGGYPCQPFSLAGKRGGSEDDRHLWPEMFRLIEEWRPTWVIGENVAGHITLGLDQVLFDLESIGYTSRPLVIPACAVDAPHRRDRVWIVAHANGDTSDTRRTQSTRQQRAPGFTDGFEDVANPAGERCGEAREHRERSKERIAGRCTVLADTKRPGLEKQQRQPRNDGPQQSPIERNGDQWSRWPTEPAVGRVAYGIPNRVDRLRALGNAIVPQVAFEIFQAMPVGHE